MSATNTRPPTGTHDLLIIGPGTVGQLVAAEWHTHYPHARITGETRSTATHAVLRAANIQPALVSDAPSNAPYILFSAPAGGDMSYARTVQQAVSRARPDARFIFTSSGSVCGKVIAPVDEDTPAATEGRPAILAAAESATLVHTNSAVIRFSGLFSIDRAAHNSLLASAVLPFPADSRLNLVHYEDAAHAVVLAMRLDAPALTRLAKRVFVVAGLHSLSLNDVCQIALRHPRFCNRVTPKFMDGPSPGWKAYNPAWTRAALAWTPKWDSYEEFMKDDATRFELESANNAT